MAGFASSSDEEMISGINVTPLVDVVLVLLVIFMMTAPVIYQSAIQVQLPKASTGEQNPKNPLSFTITREGSLLWGKDVITWQDLGERIKTLGPEVTERSAMISADQATPHGTVIRLMDMLRQVGLTRFALTVDGSTPTR